MVVCKFWMETDVGSRSPVASRNLFQHVAVTQWIQHSPHLKLQMAVGAAAEKAPAVAGQWPPPAVTS